MQTTVRNWFGSITSTPSIVVEVETVEEIVAIVTDPEHYPGPVRAVGSNHSTTACGTADGGTVIVMRRMDEIIDIGGDTVTAQAGALYIDVNHELRRHRRQFFVNVELGNLTIGSAATGGTKDASMAGEFGQIASYAVAMKMVLPNGELLEVTEDDPERHCCIGRSAGGATTNLPARRPGRESEPVSEAAYRRTPARWYVLAGQLVDSARKSSCVTDRRCLNATVPAALLVGVEISKPG